MGTFRCLLAPACSAQTGWTGWIFKQRRKNASYKARGTGLSLCSYRWQSGSLSSSLCYFNIIEISGDTLNGSVPRCQGISGGQGGREQRGRVEVQSRGPPSLLILPPANTYLTFRDLIPALTIARLFKCRQAQMLQNLTPFTSFTWCNWAFKIFQRDMSRIPWCLHARETSFVSVQSSKTNTTSAKTEENLNYKHLHPARWTKLNYLWSKS